MRGKTLFIVIIISLSIPVLAQKQKSDLFWRVPRPQRQQFKKQLNDFLAAVQRDDVNAYYDLLFGLPQDMTKEKWVTLPRDFKTLDFTPQSVDRKNLKMVDGAHWRIKGVTTVQKNDGSKESMDGMIYAQLRKNVWYFTGVITQELVIEKKILTLK